MARGGEYTYDSVSMTWKFVGSSTSTEKKESTQDTVSKGANDNLVASNTDKDSSKGSAEKEYNKIEYNILSGTLKYIATKATLKLKAGDTVTIKGIGKYLSGDYYVQDVSRSFTKSSGYSHSATLVKTDFGNTLKSGVGDDSVSNVIAALGNVMSKVFAELRDSADSVDTTELSKVHYLKKGQSLWTLAEIYYGNGSLYTKIAEANDISPSEYLKLPIGKKIIIP